MFINMRACVFVCVQACMRAHLCLCVYVCVYVCVCVCVCVCMLGWIVILRGVGGGVLHQIILNILMNFNFADTNTSSFLVFLTLSIMYLNRINSNCNYLNIWSILGFSRYL